jgi:hypothetical protein
VPSSPDPSSSHPPISCHGLRRRGVSSRASKAARLRGRVSSLARKSSGAIRRPASGRPRSACLCAQKLVGGPGGLLFQADPGDGRRLRGDGARASLLDDRASLFMTARAYLRASPATLRKVSPSAHRVPGLWKKRARALRLSADFLAMSRDFAANKPASSSSLGILEKTSPYAREVPGH